jgi:hypothetical protein
MDAYLQKMILKSFQDQDTESAPPTPTATQPSIVRGSSVRGLQATLLLEIWPANRVSKWSMNIMKLKKI